MIYYKPSQAALYIYSEYLDGVYDNTSDTMINSLAYLYNVKDKSYQAKFENYLHSENLVLTKVGNYSKKADELYDKKQAAEANFNLVKYINHYHEVYRNMLILLDVRNKAPLDDYHKINKAIYKLIDILDYGDKSETSDYKLYYKYNLDVDSQRLNKLDIDYNIWYSFVHNRRHGHFISYKGKVPVSEVKPKLKAISK